MFDQSNFQARHGNTQLFDQRTAQHLRLVYSTLGLSLLSCTAGIASFWYYHLPIFLFFVLSVALVLVISFARQNTPLRLASLFTFAALVGNSLGPLIAQTLELDPLLPLQASFLTTVVFACFSIGAMTADTKTRIYFYSIVSATATGLLFVTLFSLFTPIKGLHSVILFASMIVWCGYIVYDTEVMLVRLALGRQDFVDDALKLFIDFVQLFVRILIALSKNKKKDDK